MKKSSSIMLCSVLAAAIASCGGRQQNEDWVVGDEGGRTRDTTLHDRPYRHYGGFWYPIIAGRIAPGAYHGATASEISRPGFTPARVRTGGFGASSRTVSG